MARNFNKNLKFIRQQKGISQQELADKLNLDRSTISRWENDEMDITVGNAIQISDYFNIPLEDFSKHKDILTEDDKEYMKFIIEKRKKEIDKQLGEK